MLHTQHIELNRKPALQFQQPIQQYICLACENYPLLERQVKASFGTTKYCTNFLKGQQCKIKECVYLHQHPKDKDSTQVLKKEEMNNSKWLFSYSQKLAQNNFKRFYTKLNYKSALQKSVLPTIQNILDQMVHSRVVESLESLQQQQQQQQQQQKVKEEFAPPTQVLEKRLEAVILKSIFYQILQWTQIINKIINLGLNSQMVKMSLQIQRPSTNQNSMSQSEQIKILKMIVLSQQNQIAKQKLTKFLLNNDIRFSQKNQNEYEAIVKIKFQQDKNDQLLKQIKSKYAYIQKSLETLIHQKSLQTDLKRKQIIQLKEQKEEFIKILEIYQRSQNFSEQLKSIFYVALYYYYLQHPLSTNDIQIDEIAELFRIIFFNNKVNENTNQRQKKIIHFCYFTYRSPFFQEKLQFKQQSHSQTEEKSNKFRQSPQIHKSNSPISKQLFTEISMIHNKSNLEDLSSSQLYNYYTKLKNRPVTVLSRSCTPPIKRSKTPPKKVFRI